MTYGHILFKLQYEPIRALTTFSLWPHYPISLYCGLDGEFPCFRFYVGMGVHTSLVGDSNPGLPCFQIPAYLEGAGKFVRQQTWGKRVPCAT